VTEPDVAGRAQILDRFEPLFAGTGGIDSWLSNDTPQYVFDQLLNIADEPLTRSKLNQLLILSHEAGLSTGFYRYYWLDVPDHTYDVSALPGFDPVYATLQTIASVDQLYWGLYRFYVDALLHFGNVRSAYRALRDLEHQELTDFYVARRFHGDEMQARGAALPLQNIARDDRYLISEVACKTLAGVPGTDAELKTALVDALHGRSLTDPTTVRSLLEGSKSENQQMFLFSAGDFAEETVIDEADLLAKYDVHQRRFERARAAALRNTELYLSMIDDLDVYVATSMRTRDDFRSMADFCSQVFTSERIANLNIRYFDPTVSAAEGHQDKGLIECLMVKCAKVLVYHAGTRDSYGKDAEAAMALSLGKPVIFFCDGKERGEFLRDIHPLSRLIDFSTGVAVGSIVTDNAETVIRLLDRIFANKQQYKIVKKTTSGYLCLHETLTDSVVRLQTDDVLLRETFWNYYHRAHR
jgi:hypothetical protein